MTSWLESIEKRLREATPGPWSPCLGSGHHECTAIHWEGNSEHPYGLFVCDLVPDWLLDKKYEKDLEFKSNNMNFIANCPTDVERLLKAHKIMREALDITYMSLADCVSRKSVPSTGMFQDIKKALAEVDKLGE